MLMVGGKRFAHSRNDLQAPEEPRRYGDLRRMWKVWNDQLRSWHSSECFKCYAPKASRASNIPPCKVTFPL